MRYAAILVLVFFGCGGPEGPPPVVVFLEEHHEALEVWRSLAAEGTLPVETVLVHLDAHEDMGVPDPDEGELTVSNFIVPALREGILSEVVWVTPPWLGEIPRDELRAGHDFRIVGLDELADLRGRVALDIDLDFFVTENPHDGHRDAAISKKEYDRLLASRRIRMRGTRVEAGRRTDSAVLARPEGRFTWPVRVDRITDLETGDVRYVRGYVCMGEYAGEFPVHRPSETEWRSLVAKVGEALRRSGLRPVVITVSRSSTSGFVPEEVIDPLAEAVGEMLREVY